MARFIPEIEYIENQIRPTPQPGELWLIHTLSQLNDDYEVYFQPFLNGDHPDVVILKRGCGAYIIEVKDYNLDVYDYEVTPRNKYGQLRVLTEVNKPGIMTPMEQVMRYKDNLFSLHSIKMKDTIFDNRYTYRVIKTSVFFYYSTEERVKQVFSKYDDKHMGMWGYNTDICTEIERKLGYWDELFTDEMYEEMRLLFRPSYNLMEQNEIPQLNKRQLELSVSNTNKQVKIKGVAGSGKTLVLAKRAINAYEQTRRPVLILTFNITLRNYIKDKISQFRPNVKMDVFYIIHFHQFLRQQLTEYGILSSNNLENEDKDHTSAIVELLKQELKDKDVRKFDTILIDEVQDFEYDWLELVKKCFLKENGEYVLLGDEKQNIYDRELDKERTMHTNVSGRWTKLDQSYRMKKEIAMLANSFQSKFLSGKYEVDQINAVQQDLFSKEDIEYYSCLDQDIIDVWSIIQNYRHKNQIAFNDICILAGKVENLRRLECYLRKKQNIQCKTTFEKEEQYEKLEQRLNQGSISKREMQLELDSLRRVRKFNFWMNSGEMKLSTIHSFKGWEAHTLVLILDDPRDVDNEELIYTAITRCKTNLLIISTVGNKYEPFFRGNIEKCY